MNRRAPLFRWTVAALALAAFGCNSPTLPLPPPAAPDVSAVSPGKVHLSSVRGVEPNAIIVTYNRNPNVALGDRVYGAQADENGTWEQTITASPGDVVDLTQEFGSTRSPPTSIQIPK